MSRREGFVVRLAVGRTDGPNSATFRFWSPDGKSDIYASVRDIAGECKISLHESGECFAGLTEPFALKETKAVGAMGGSRHQSRWVRRTHTEGLVVTPLQFAVPASELTSWRRSPVQDAGIKWIDPPGVGRSVIISCVFSHRVLSVGEWPGRQHQVHLIASKVLPNGETFWLLWRDCPTGDQERSMLAMVCDRVATETMVRFSRTAPSVSAPRVLIFKELQEAGLLFIVDAAAA